jgi:hypothetical protein
MILQIYLALIKSLVDVFRSIRTKVIEVETQEPHKGVVKICLFHPLTSLAYGIAFLWEKIPLF